MRKITREEFVQRAMDIHHSLYDYSSVVFINTKTKVSITCPIHGEFYQTPSNHLLGKGCTKCKGSRISEAKTKSQKKVIDQFREVHGSRYDYSLVEYKNGLTRVKIICPKCGVFEQRPKDHLLGEGCSKCGASKGEKAIREWLFSHGIEFEEQKIFRDCRGKKRPLPFDFYIPNRNACIEYDGEQHFGVGRRSKDENVNILNYHKTVQSDEVKTQYCSNNGIYLLRIPYQQIRDIGSILEKYFMNLQSLWAVDNMKKGAKLQYKAA
jgi:very-short-patch-repair endonuclease